MSNTPNIEVSSTDKNLNQRFRKQKSNLPILILVGVLGIGIVATPFLISGGNEEEEPEKKVAQKKEKQQPKPELSESSFDSELFAGETATVALGKSLQNADAALCKVEWNVLETTLPRNIIEKVSVDDQLNVSIPTEGITQNRPASRDSVAPSNDWKLVGTIKSGEASTKEFTINLKLKLRNSPPVAKLPTAIEFDPILGADIQFVISDQESAADQLTAELMVEPEFAPNVKLETVAEKSIIRYRPATPEQKAFSVKVQVEDPEGAASTFAINLTPKAQSGIAKLVTRLAEENGIDFSKANIGRIGSVISLTASAAGEPLELIENLAGNGSDEKENLPAGRSRFRKGGLVAICSSTNDQLKNSLIKQLGQPVAPATPAIATKKASTNAKLLTAAGELLDDKQLFNSKNFGSLVFAFVEDFERENATVLSQKYSELEGLKEFMDAQKGLKAELFLAIDPAHDNLASTLNVLNEIRKAYPKEIVPYKNLAIAIAVCWDVPNANYSFVGHQRRTKSILPENLTGAVENFKHFVTYQNQMQGRAQWLPWEFLVHVINHRTPDQEKYWALENYLAQRSLFGKCYKEVPYDYEMLKTKSQVCKLGGKEYSLPNLRQYGGVCAMQADFAARVGKSLGVPSEYVGGQSANGENHAWVMWVEIKNVTRSGIAFSLESFGRYRGDNYYVGTLKDPKSGMRITDRQLELRLHTVGTDAYAKRHVDLLLRAFPELVQTRELDIKEQLKYLEQAIKLCPWHEEAWNAVANLIANNDIDKKMHRQMNQILNSMFVHFAPFPDFTWEIFDRLVSFVPKADDRNKYYVKLLNLYVAAQRPDLACEAQLKLTDYLEEQEKTQIAMQGLAVTVKTFPDEGRYVPRLLDRLEKLVGDDPELIKQLIQFHAEFLPLVPQKRGNSPSKYCIKMYQRAIQFFTKHGATAFAELYQNKLQELQAAQ